MKKILVVDNNPVIVNLMVNFLGKKLGHHVKTAFSGLEAIEILESFVPDILCIDLVMPKISGDKLCHIVRNTPRLQNVFIIILSAVAAEQEIDLNAIGADAFIAKGAFSETEKHLLAVLEGVDSTDQKNRSLKVLGVDHLSVRNITKELLHFQKHYELILHNISDGIVEMSATECGVENEQQHRIIYCNDKAVSLFGCVESGILGSDFASHFVADDRQRLSAALDNVQENPISLGDQAPLRLHDNYCHLSLVPIWESGEKTIIAIVRDVSQQFQLENQLRQTYKMEALGALAGGIAHDFNNILTIILGFADMAKDGIPEDNPVNADLERILDAVRRAKGLVSQILTFSRKDDSQLKPVRADLFVRESLKLLRASIPTSIEIRHDICSECGTVVANPTQIHQLVLNLCTNAAQAIGDKGHIDVHLSEVYLSEEDISSSLNLQVGNYLKLEVSDDGPGIDGTIIGRIFDPFFTTKKVGQGTGMGLSVVHGIVTSLGGSISVQSERGKGATFRVYFPVSQEEGEVCDASLDPVPRGDESILIVDDEMLVGHMMKQMLEGLGYDATVRTSSVEAFEAFRNNPDKYDLVITDQGMPNMTGKELVLNILEIRPDLPIILCTGFSDQIDNEEAERIGIKAFILKPVDKRELAETVRVVLGCS